VAPFVHAPATPSRLDPSGSQRRRATGIQSERRRRSGTGRRAARNPGRRTSHSVAQQRRAIPRGPPDHPSRRAASTMHWTSTKPGHVRPPLRAPERWSRPGDHAVLDVMCPVSRHRPGRAGDDRRHARTWVAALACDAPASTAATRLRGRRRRSPRPTFELRQTISTSLRPLSAASRNSARSGPAAGTGRHHPPDHDPVRRDEVSCCRCRSPVGPDRGKTVERSRVPVRAARRPLPRCPSRRLGDPIGRANDRGSRCCRSCTTARRGRHWCPISPAVRRAEMDASTMASRHRCPSPASSDERLHTASRPSRSSARPNAAASLINPPGSERGGHRGGHLASRQSPAC